MKYSKLLPIVLMTLISCNKNNSNDSFQNTFEYEQFSSNLDEQVQSVFFIDNQNGFATGNGTVFKTTDGGLTWNRDRVSNVPLNSVYFVNSKIGYAVGGQSSCAETGCTVPGSVVYKTVDSGNSWEKLSIPYALSALNSVSFINENVGFAVGLGLQIKTTDGGKTWKQFELGYQGLMKKILFVDKQTGFCAGLYGNIYKTSNQGDSWIKSQNESNGHVYDFCFVNEVVGYAGGQKQMVKTTDGGATWKILSDSPSEIYYIHFSDLNHGIAIGKGHFTGGDLGIWTHALYSTQDGGLTWNMEDNIEFASVTCFYENNTGYAVVPNKTFKITIK